VISPLPAVAFLTRVPVPGGRTIALGDVARSQAWFALVGLGIGAMLVGFDRLAMRALPDPSVDVVLVVALAAVTGALHLDGLADTADGLLGGAIRERRLEIMRDVHAGTYGIVALVSVLALKWAGLSALPASVRVEALLIVPCMARCGLVVCAAAFPYAREQGLGRGFRRHAWPVGMTAATMLAAVAGVALLGVGGLYALGCGMGVALSVGWIATRLAGGVTGDVFGAVVEVSEAVLLLFIAAMANRGWIDAWALR
jgi:adenosylcobinamide-GDP ribazoletransferase